MKLIAALILVVAGAMALLSREGSPFKSGGIAAPLVKAQAFTDTSSQSGLVVSALCSQAAAQRSPLKRVAPCWSRSMTTRW